MNVIIDERINHIKESVMKFVQAKYIYLFGSYAYGDPTEKSDIDVYIVTPDNINNFSELYTKIIGDLSDKKIFFIDLLMNTESVFDARKEKNIFEKTIHQKGKIIYGHWICSWDVNFSIEAVEKIRNLKQIIELRNIIHKENK